MSEEEEQVEHKPEILQVDTVLDSCVLAEGKRWYQIKWKPTWMPEERLPEGVLANFQNEENSTEENDGKFRVSEKRSTDDGAAEYLLGRGNTWESESKLNSIDATIVSSYWSQLSNLKEVVKIEEDLDEYGAKQLNQETMDKADADSNALNLDPMAVPMIKTEVTDEDNESVECENNTTASGENENGDETVEDDITCTKCNSMLLAGQITHEIALSNHEKTTEYSQCMKCGEMFCTICASGMGELRHNGKTTLFCDNCINNFATQTSLPTSKNIQKVKQSRKQVKPSLIRIQSKKKTDPLSKIEQLVKKQCEQCNKNLLGDDLVQTGDDSFKCIDCFKMLSHDGSLSVNGGVEVNSNKVVVGGKHITEKGIKVLSGRHKSHVVHRDQYTDKSKSNNDNNDKVDEEDVPNLDCDETSLNIFEEEDMDAPQDDNTVDSKEEGNYKCSDCGRCFNRQYTLDTHQRIHTGEKPYVCEICGARFRQSGTKLNHVRAVHTKERPFQCQYCGKTFSHKSSITVHIRIHTKEKPYQCQTCERCFTDRATYLKHQSIHSGVKPYHCPMCTRKFSQKSNLKRHYKNIHELGKPDKTSKSNVTTSSSSGEGSTLEGTISSTELSAISTAMAQISSTPEYPSIANYSSLANNTIVYTAQNIKIEEPDQDNMDFDPPPVLVMPEEMVSHQPETSS